MKLVVVFCILLGLISWANDVKAQCGGCNFTFPEEVQDDFYIDRLLPNGDTLAANMVFPLWRFHFFYDSSQINYTFTELEQNGTKVELDWGYGQEINNLTPDSLSDITRSRQLSVSKYDIISFSREFTWKHVKDVAFQYLNNYYANDTIEFVTGLINAAGQWRETLDSFGIFRRIPAGAPTFYGNDPSVMTHISHVVSGNFSNTPMRVKIKVIVKGDGNYYPLRKDDYGGRISAILNDPEWSDFISDMGIAPKINPNQLLQEHPNLPNNEIQLNVWPNPTSDLISISVESIEDHTSKSIVIYDNSGRRIFSPLANFTDKKVITGYRLQIKGTYYVVLYREDKISAVQPITVQ